MFGVIIIPDIEDWKPTASWEKLRLRARLLARIRAFFGTRGVVEVETPVLSAATVTDPQLSSMSCLYEGPGAPDGRKLFLQTSPEYAMKRLLAAGSGPIYQISKAFRNGEMGRYHNPEFTILEWYRPGFDHHALMDEVDAFLDVTLGAPPAERLTYGEVFRRYVGVDPYGAGPGTLGRRARELGLEEMPGTDEQLDLLMTHSVEPHLGRARPTFLYDFPPSKASLARVRQGNPPVAERFEVYFEGVELANGFHELTDVTEQRRRFEADLERRRLVGREEVGIDERVLAALAAGLPSSAGVALGVDRLVMLAAGAGNLSEVIAFPVDRA